MSGHYLVITADVNGRGARRYEILGGGQFLDKARKALAYRTALVIPAVHPQALPAPVRALVQRGAIVFPADSIRDVRMG